MKKMRIEYERAKNGQFFVRIKARNGRILFTSETYKQKGGAKNVVRALFRGLTDFEEIENW